MKSLILLFSLSLALTACGGGSKNRPPAGAVGLWGEVDDVETADNLNIFSLNNGECSTFFTDSNFPELTATYIEDSGEMFTLTSDAFGVFRDDIPMGSMNRDGFVTLNLPAQAIELGTLPEIRFELTGPNSAVGTTSFEQGSLAIEVSELVRIDELEFEVLADRVNRFCTFR